MTAPNPSTDSSLDSSPGSNFNPHNHPNQNEVWRDKSRTGRLVLIEEVHSDHVTIQSLTAHYKQTATYHFRIPIESLRDRFTYVKTILPNSLDSFEGLLEALIGDEPINIRPAFIQTPAPDSVSNPKPYFETHSSMLVEKSRDEEANGHIDRAILTMLRALYEQREEEGDPNG